MAVALHGNVGLMHASMAIFNAYCDRVPMLLLGANGPVDALERRPWIDWIHTAADLGALIRNYCKWDDEPGSARAAIESLIRADAVTRSYPSAPCFVCLDSAIQEVRLAEPVQLPPLERYRPPEAPAPSAEVARHVLDLLRNAHRPLVLVGRVGRDSAAWDARVRLVETLGLCAVSGLNTAAAFPSAHRLHPAAPGVPLTAAGLELLRRADVVLSLDWIDLAGTLDLAFGTDIPATIVSCSGDAALHNGWSKDSFALPLADLAVNAHPDALVAALLAKMSDAPAQERSGWPGNLSARRASPAERSSDELVLADIAVALRRAVAGRAICWTYLPQGWPSDAVEIADPLDYLGMDGGGGLGSGPGLAVGAALALAGSGRLPVAVLGDGDFLMGGSALWTATHHRLPLLVVVANNRSYFNDEAHQEWMARTRGRPTENRSVGEHIRNPDPDLSGFAQSLGARGHGPIRKQSELANALSRAVADVVAGEVAVVDIRTTAHVTDDFLAWARRPGAER
jgi:thiamine pyrophosphate-dependent acetolactate synthase large subunit-like protein